jgi:hypothetical protein
MIRVGHVTVAIQAFVSLAQTKGNDIWSCLDELPSCVFYPDVHRQHFHVALASPFLAKPFCLNPFAVEGQLYIAELSHLLLKGHKMRPLRKSRYSYCPLHAT